MEQLSSIAALCEVWTNRERELLLGAWRNAPEGYNSKISERSFSSSGLVTISKEYPVSDGGFHRYEAESEEDTLAGKGVLLTHVDVGLGASKLDIYSTHLNAGGIKTKLTQFVEMISFIVETRQPDNPSVIVGDFNLDAHDTESIEAELLNRLSLKLPTGIEGFEGSSYTVYSFMERMLEQLGFQDLWKIRGQLLSGPTKGYTIDMISQDAPNIICPTVIEDGLMLCGENNLVAANSRRIDYIFFSKPSSNQSFTLDFTRPRRLRLDRSADAPDRDEIAFLSDHIGLITTFLLVPR